MIRPTSTFLANIIERYAFPILFGCFILVQYLIYVHTGIVTNLEAEKYVNQGNYLYEHGHLSETKYIFYLPVILLVYISRVLHVSYGFVVIAQILLSGLALYFFYKLAFALGNKKTAFFSALLLTCFFPLQSWNLFLYSDSVFISLTIIYAYIIYKNQSKGIAGTLFILGMLVLLIFSRPHGLLFIPPTILFLVFKRQTRAQRITNASICAILIAGMYLLLNVAFTGGEDMDAMKPFIEEHIICFVPLQPSGVKLDLLGSGNPVNDIFYYILHNPFHFLRLMFLKLLSFFWLPRPYYSTAHNIFLAAVIIPVYVLSLRGIYLLIRKFPTFRLYLVALICLYPLGATFQCDDWHSRFTMIVFPYFILFAIRAFFKENLKSTEA